MKLLEERILATLIRVRQFGLSHAAAFPEGSRGRELFDDVGEAVGRLESLSATQAQQANAAKEMTTQKNAAAAALREQMEAIARTARAMARQSPGLQDKFRLPTGERLRTWLAVAHAFSTEAAPLKEGFVSRGLAANFFEEFRARIGAVEQGIEGRAQKSAARVSTTVAVAEAAGQGREAVRELDAIVRNVFDKDPAALAEWESASRVERAPRRAEKEAPVADGEAPAAATAPPKD